VRKYFFSGVFLLLSSACTRTTPAPAPAVTKLEVEISGCALVGLGCELPPDGKLRFFAREPKLEIRSSAGVALAATSREVQGGQLFTLTVPPEATALVLSASHGASVARSTLTLERPPPLAWVEQARTLKQRGDLDGALAQAKMAEHSQVPRERALALGAMARIELARGKIDAAVPLFREALQADRVSGRVGDLVDDAFALAFVLHQRSHRYDEARAVLDEVRENLAAYADGRARDPYYRGILSAETGDLRGALRDLREAELRASRLGLDRLARNARSAHALALLRVGRANEALASLRAIDTEVSAADGVTPCDRVEAAINLGWAALAANESGAHEDASGPLERAAAEPACSDPYLRGTAFGDLALTLLRRGDAPGAAARLADARRAVSEPSGAEQLFWLDLEARIALAGKDAPRALAVFDRACGLARASLLREAEYGCVLGRAEALEARRENRGAAAAYRAAEDILDERSALVPLGEGRGSFLGQRATSARYGVDLLARTGRIADALAMARTSRSRALAGTERAARLEQLVPAERVKWEQAIGAYRRARAEIDSDAAGDWRLPQDKLTAVAVSRKSREAALGAALEQALSVIAANAPPARVAEREPKGTLLLVLYPVRVGWLALVSDDGGVASFPLGEVDVTSDAATIASKVVAPIAARLARAKALRVLPYGALRALDVHALLYEGEPLLARLAVEYPLDLRARASSVPTAASAILGVIGDPTGDLPAARVEARSVAATLGKTGARVELLEGDRATSAAVSDLVARADVLHYAGHGVYAGQEGWDSLLPLAAGGRLTIGDVLALHHAPRRVVLSGCETARSSREGPAEGLGLGQAFVIAGSDEVVAPVRPVRDALAAALTRAFYEALPTASSASDALAHAQNAVRREMPGEDWASFRVLSP
jgi:tetratricopeptide (TPR) repeat protein